MRWPVLMICLAISMVSVSGQTFELVEPGGHVGATAWFDHGDLIVVERSGQRFFFRRDSRYDSPDGQFLAYYNFDFNRVLRFPRAGFGVMQIADLNRATPRFRFTRRQVRPPYSVIQSPSIAGYPPLTPGVGYPGYGLPLPFVPQPSLVGYRYRYPRSTLIQTRIEANPPLAPVTLELVNGGRRDIEVGVVDIRRPEATKPARLAPGQAVEVTLQRDSGATRFQRYQTFTRFGDLITREVAHPVAPAVLYEIVVHEWVMQSVAIDRTGKSPNVIEDVNFQGKGLGRFPLPPGDRLQPGSIDVYRAAVESNNPGLVAPILAEEEPTDPSAPLERAILDAQQRAVMEAQQRALRRTGN